MSSPNRQFPNIQVLCLTAVLLHHFLGSQCRHLGTDYCKVLKLDSRHTHTHTGPNAANDMHSPSAQLKNDTNPQTLKQTQACWTPKNRTLTSGALPCDSEDASFFGGCLSHCQKLLPSEMVSVIQPMALCVLPRVATLAQGCLWERKNYHMDSE